MKRQQFLILLAVLCLYQSFTVSAQEIFSKGEKIQRKNLVDTINQIETFPADISQIIADYAGTIPSYFFSNIVEKRFKVIVFDPKKPASINKTAQEEQLELVFDPAVQHGSYVRTKVPIHTFTRDNDLAEENLWRSLGIAILSTLGARKFAVAMPYVGIQHMYIPSHKLQPESITEERCKRKIISQQELNEHFNNARELINRIKKDKQQVVAGNDNSLYISHAASDISDIDLTFKQED